MLSIKHVRLSLPLKKQKQKQKQKQERVLKNCRNYFPILLFTRRP